MSETKKISLLAVLSSVFGALSVLIGELILPLAAASLAALFVSEEKKNKPVSTVVSALVVIINIASFFLNGELITFSGFCTVLFAITVYLSYTRGVRKSVCAGLLVAIYTLILMLTLAVFAAHSVGSTSLDAIVGYYTELYSDVTESSLTQMSSIMDEIVQQGGEVAFTLDDMRAIFDVLAKMIISLVVIVGFALAGITHKFFSAFILRTSGDKDRILSWRFTTTNVFAWFFLILFFVSVFFSSYDTVLSVAVGNLTTIFTFVYAYVGFSSALAFFSRRRGPVLPFILLTLGVLTFSSFAVELLALVGAFDVIKNNRTEARSV